MPFDTPAAEGVTTPASTVRRRPTAVAEDAMSAYLQQLSTIALLSPAEEARLARRVRDTRDRTAEHRLVTTNLRFVVYVARGYLGYGLPMADLVQAGNIGLIKAVKRFDPDQGSRLASFAIHHIRAEIHDYVMRNWSIVRLVTTKAQRKLFYHRRQLFADATGAPAKPIENLAAELGVRASDVKTMNQRMAARDLSLEGTDETGARASSWLSDGGRQARAAEEEIWLAQLSERLPEALSQLDPRALDIIQQRWLSAAEPATLGTLARIHNISAERVRQIQRDALAAMRRSLAPRGAGARTRYREGIRWM